MGLGKTLTMLSAIIMSLRSADEFAMINDQMNVDGPGKAALGYVKGTLVVVPSEREFVRYKGSIN